MSCGVHWRAKSTKKKNRKKILFFFVVMLQTHDSVKDVNKIINYVVLFIVTRRYLAVSSVVYSVIGQHTTTYFEKLEFSILCQTF